MRSTHFQQGARERCSLPAHLGGAGVAASEPQFLIRRMLVNTDAVRQERVLDVLTALSAKMQIIVLTCHADRYRGVGQTLTVRPVRG